MLPVAMTLTTQANRAAHLRTSFARFAICLGFTALVSAQMPNMIAPAQAPATFNISGTVVNSVTGEPIQRALVQTGTSAAMTNAEGHFEFDDLSQGYLAMQAIKPGFFSEQNPGLSLNSFAAMVEASTRVVTLKLTPFAVIAGTVTGGKGEPLEGVPVRATYVHIVEGRKRWEMRAQTQTNQDGEYRIADLTPGIYYFAAGPKSDFENAPPVLARAVGAQGYLSTYYPGAPDLDSATALRLAPGQHVQADFALHPVPLFSLAGAVSGIPANSRSSAQLIYGSGQPAQVAGIDPGTLKFQFRAVPAGIYRIEATGQDDANQVFHGETSINLQRDTDDAHVALNPLPPIPVEVQTVSVRQNSNVSELGPGLSGPFVHLVQVYLRPAEAGMRPEYFSVMEQNASGPAKQLILSVQPGRYSVAMVTMAQWYVQAASSGATDLLREDLVVTSGRVDPIVVALRDDSATLTVNIKSEGKTQPSLLLMIPDAAPSAARNADPERAKQTLHKRSGARRLQLAGAYRSGFS
jgi:hypothetical protein